MALLPTLTDAALEPLAALSTVSVCWVKMSPSWTWLTVD